MTARPAAVERGDEPRASEFASALGRGDVDRVRALLAADPTLATSVINSYRPLHLFADAPGHRPHAAAIVAALVTAGADLDAHAVGAGHHETALHWAASNDDVELVDVLVDAGADIEHPGSSIGGGPPSQSALGYGQWAALRRLYERGAVLSLAQAAALGLTSPVTSLVEDGEPSVEDLSVALWNACRAGQPDTARYLVDRGADVHWQAPWSDQTPLDVAVAEHRDDVVAWLRSVRR
ncbi:MAG TPA: ankyrin repeat domain-containing protein [Pseudonocardiaceae bacterium]|nr:ankyrin repeat domain-containing protein [Pseudonocardiaceae bacterium]